MANAQHNIKAFHMISVQDLLTLKQMRLIGQVKKGLVHSTVIVFKNARETNGFVISLQGSAHAKLLRKSALPEDVLLLTAKNAAHTLYKAVEIIVDLEPMYTDAELGR